MSLPRPPITTDRTLNDWTDRVHTEVSAQQKLLRGQAIQLSGAGESVLRPSVNTAFLYMFKRTSLTEDHGLIKPNRIDTRFRYQYDTGTLWGEDAAGDFTVSSEKGFNGWHFGIPPRDPVVRNDYIWFQTVAIAERGPYETIRTIDWSEVQLYIVRGQGALRAVYSYEPFADATNDPVLTKHAIKIVKIYLGELDITPYVHHRRICWMLAELDGSVKIDKFIEDNGIAAVTQYSDRNVNLGIPQYRGFSIEIPILELFSRSGGVPTDFTTCGATDNNLGTQFVATSIPYGDGIVESISLPGQLFMASDIEISETYVIRGRGRVTGNNRLEGANDDGVFSKKSREGEARIDISNFLEFKGEN